MNRLRTCFVFSAVLLLTTFSSQAELRKPTAEEQQVLGKYAAVINKILDHFQSDDWNESVDYAIDDDVMVHPDSGRPLDVNEMFQRSYTIRPGSDRFNRLVQPAITAMQRENDPAKKAQITKGIPDLMHVQVQVHFNRENIGFQPPPSQNQDLKIPGTAFAYKTGNNPTSHGVAYLLAFGNWSPLAWDAAHSWYHFKFAHPQNTPFIENVEIGIFGAPDRVEELLHKIDWKEVNDALTR